MKNLHRIHRQAGTGMAQRMTVLLIIVAGIAALLVYMIRMPGESFDGTLPPLDADGRERALELEHHVRVLCANPAGRHYLERGGLAAARDYIAGQFEASGYAVEYQSYEIDGEDYANIEAVLAGNRLAEEIIVVGAHYDAVIGSPGANDNASGVAALLALAHRFRDAELPRTLRFVAFVNEEPPHFLTENMGSDVYARRAARQRENIVAMYALETIGYYRDTAGSQRYPPPFNLFYPQRGNFIAFVGNLRSRALLTRSLHAFRQHASFPSEGVAAPAFIPGVDWSDHRSFWQQGYPALMVTDTAPYRYPHYHSPRDTPNQVDYDSLVYVVDGLAKMLEELARRD